MRALPIFLIAFLGATSHSFADDAPNFLKGRTFATESANCKGADDGDGLQLNREGIFGQEFSCSFVGFKIDKDTASGRVFSVVATASCSDDSGISRPDLINLSPYIEGGEVYVQSQNEYLLYETEVMIAQQAGKEIPQKYTYAYVSDTYKICE